VFFACPWIADALERRRCAPKNCAVSESEAAPCAGAGRLKALDLENGRLFERRQPAEGLY
jgi:hypothetical protein